jgi:probable HAF family extracellular repeat protein
MAVALLVGFATPAAAGAGTGQEPLRADRPPRITATVLVDADGAELAAAIRVTERGHVLVGSVMGSPPAGSAGVWNRGTFRPVAPPPDAPPGPTFYPLDISERDQVVAAHLTPACGPAPLPILCPAPVTWSDGVSSRLPTDGLVGAPIDVNDRGQVAGWIGVPLTRSQAVVWDDGTIVTAPTGSMSEARGINNRGEAVIQTRVDGASRAEVWRVGGRLTDLGTLGGRDTFARGINARGHVTGTSQAADGTQHVFLWRNHEMADLGTFGSYGNSVQAFNDRDQIVIGGAVDEGEPPSAVAHTYLWDDGEATDLGPGPGRVVARDINNRGQIVGYSDQADGARHAVLWHDGRWIDLHPYLPAAGRSSAVDINDRGQIVGEADGHAVMWTVR